MACFGRHRAVRSTAWKAGTERRTGRQAVPVRGFANDDIYFHVKRIDNSRVVRQADPKTGGVCWRMIGSVAAAAMLLIGVLLPSAYGLLAGYQIQALREEAKHLTNEQASLELEEARLLSPERMEQLAREQQFIDPEPQKVVYLDSTHGAAVAMNEPSSDVRNSGRTQQRGHTEEIVIGKRHAGKSVYPAAQVAAVVDARVGRGDPWTAGVFAGIPPRRTAQDGAFPAAADGFDRSQARHDFRSCRSAARENASRRIDPGQSHEDPGCLGCGRHPFARAGCGSQGAVQAHCDPRRTARAALCG